MELLLWILMGGIAGCLASIIMGTDAEQGALMNIVLGIVGALVGGFIVSLVGLSGATGFNIYSLLVAIFGAVILIAISRAVYR